MVQEVKVWFSKHWKQILIEIGLRVATVCLTILSTYIPHFPINGLVTLGLLEAALQSAEARVRSLESANAAQLGIPVDMNAAATQPVKPSTPTV